MRIRYSFFSSRGLATPAVNAAGQLVQGGEAGIAKVRGGTGRSARDEDFVLQRVRIYFDADVNKNVRGFVKLQDSRTLGESNIADNEERTDLLEAFVELRNLGDLSPMLSNLNLKIGRWQAHYGNHRLIGTLNWANQARSYDGARLKWSNKKNAWIDLFAHQIQEEDTGGVSGSRQQTDNSAGTTSLQARDEVIYGIYSQFKFSGALEGNLVEPYFIARSRSDDVNLSGDRDTGEVRYSAGFRLDGRKMPSLAGLDYTVEPVWQFGKVNGVRGETANLGADLNPAAGNSGDTSDSIQAWAIYAGAGYTFKDMPWTPRIGYAYVFASGDDKPLTGSAKTFDHLYPTGHAQLGYIDNAAWQNIEDHQIHLSFKPTKKLLVDLKGHIFSLDEEADAWYSVGGGTGYGGGRGVIRAGADQFINSAGVLENVDDDLGQEIDLTVKYKLFKNFSVVAGYSHYFADDFIEDTGGGGGNGIDRGADWVYLMTSMKF